MILPMMQPNLQRPSISVALCTCNGERFLDEQLMSLADQSRTPGELVVFDDGSTDATLEILRSFASKAPFPVEIHQNLHRLKPAQNFAAAAAACTSDIISFCDQDDIWEANKIEMTLAAFARDPAVAFVFSDAEMCDESALSLGYRLWNSVGFAGPLRRKFDDGHGFDVLLRQNVVTGATLSIASRYRSVILPIAQGWMHDGWIALLLSAVGQGVAIDQPLIRYRQHATQSIGARRRTLYQQYLNALKMDRLIFSKQADEYAAALVRLVEQTEFEVAPRKLQLLANKIQHCRRRSSIRQGEIGRVLPSLKELLTMRYQRFSLGWKSFAQDLFL